MLAGNASPQCLLPPEQYPLPIPTTEGRRLTFGRAGLPLPRAVVWDQLWRGESPGRVAVFVTPSAERVQRLKDTYTLDLVEVGEKPEGWSEEWERDLREGLYLLAAQAQLPGDGDFALNVPRPLHGQSQGLVDIFGARAELQPDGNFFAHPLPADPVLISGITPAPLETSLYWRAVEWIRYAREATGGAIPFRNPVMTGPLDTANYLLGSTTLFEWLYTQPEVVHRLLDTVTEVLIALLQALAEAAGGALCPHLGYPARGGFELCSEVRSIISSDHYEEFEAPYLRRIGERLGPFAVHACGNWEHTIPSALRDGCLRVMHGQSKENDIARLCREAQGKITLVIGRSANLQKHYLWPDVESFLRHVLATVPEEQPLVIDVSEDDLPLWLELHRQICGQAYPLRPAVWAD